MMIQWIPNSVVLNYMIFIAMQLKWVCDYLLYTPFFHHRPSADISTFPGFVEDLPVREFDADEDSDDPTDCAVCLCKIDGGDEVRELRCGHLFHRVCLDRWIGNGHATCPLCRNHMKPRLFTAELHQEVIRLGFSAVAGGCGDRCTWWLR